MEFGLNEILTIIDKVKSTELSLFQYEDADTKIKIKGTKQGTAQAVKSEKKAYVPQPYEDGTSKAAAETQPEAEDHSSLAAEEGSKEEGNIITSPMVGTFYCAPAEDKEPYVKVGDTVKKGQTIGIVEAMKLMNEIESEYEGTVREILVTNGQMVEYGQPLVRISEV